jgi:hypothetical protein
VVVQCTSVIPALGRLRQEDDKFKVSLGYVVKPCLSPTPKKIKEEKKKRNLKSYNTAF